MEIKSEFAVAHVITLEQNEIDILYKVMGCTPPSHLEKNCGLTEVQKNKWLNIYSRLYEEVYNKTSNLV